MVEGEDVFGHWEPHRNGNGIPNKNACSQIIQAYAQSIKLLADALVQGPYIRVEGPQICYKCCFLSCTERQVGEYIQQACGSAIPYVCLTTCILSGQHYCRSFKFIWHVPIKSKFCYGSVEKGTDGKMCFEALKIGLLTSEPAIPLLRRGC